MLEEHKKRNKEFYDLYISFSREIPTVEYPVVVEKATQIFF